MQDNLNYAPVAVGAVLILSLLWWVVDARKWFKGPVRNIDENARTKALCMAYTVGARVPLLSTMRVLGG